MEGIVWLQEYLNTSRDYIIHLQQITLLLATASALLIYFSKKICWWTLGVAFFLSVINSIVGFYLYAHLLEIILEFKNNNSPDITSIRCFVNIQFWLNIVVLVLISINIVCKGKK